MSGVNATAYYGNVSVTLSAHVLVGGVSCYGYIGSVFLWGTIIPDQNPSFSSIEPSSAPGWTDISGATTSYTDVAPSQSPSYSSITPAQNPQWLAVSA